MEESSGQPRACAEETVSRGVPLQMFVVFDAAHVQAVPSLDTCMGLANISFM